MKRRHLVLSLFLIFSSNLALANGYFGAVLGLQTPTQGALKTRFAYGLDGGFKIIDMFSVGANFNLSSKEIAAATSISTALSANLSTFHLHGRFFPIGGFYAGLGLGFTSASIDTSIVGIKVTASHSSFSFGPQVGYDLVIAGTFSVGLHLDYIFVPESEEKVGAFTVKQNSFGLFNALATAKFWF